MKPDNSKNLTIGCFVLMMASVEDQLNMVFLVDKTSIKLTFLPQGALCVPLSPF